MSMSISGKIALVTGARGGIGAAIARALAAAGATVAVSGRAPGDCEAVVADIRQAGGTAFDFALDVSDLDKIRERIDSLVADAGGLDILVNNAAVIEPMAPVATLDPQAFDRAMRVNVSGPAALVRAAWPHFAAGGRIINLLSGAALRPLDGWAAYCTSKAALLMFTRAADAEGRDSGIRCFGVAPGLVDTDMQARIREARINEVSDIPREKLSDPVAAADSVAWLASGEGDDLSGRMLDVRDGELTRRLRAGGQ